MSRPTRTFLLLIAALALVAGPALSSETPPGALAGGQLSVAPLPECGDPGNECPDEVCVVFCGWLPIIGYVCEEICISAVSQAGPGASRAAMASVLLRYDEKEAQRLRVRGKEPPLLGGAPVLTWREPALLLEGIAR